MINDNIYNTELCITPYIIIDKPTVFKSKLEELSGISNINLDDVVNFIKTQKNTLFYFDTSLKLKNPEDKYSEIKYLWCDTGILDRQARPLFLSLINRRGYYSGHFAGFGHFFAERAEEYNPHYTTVIRDNYVKFKEGYYKKIAERDVADLMDKYKNSDKSEASETKMGDKLYTNSKPSIEREVNKYWEGEILDISKDINDSILINNFKDIRGLDRYIKIIGVRIPQLISKGETKYYFLNQIKSAVVNTGLIDKFGSYICVVYRKHIGFNLYTPYKVIERKADYVKEGFTEEKTEIPPISFMEGEVFDATMDTIDITPRAMSHIIEERKNRFPENVRDLSDMALASKLHSALDIGLRLQHCDPSYIKPSYSGKTGEISWLFPLHINRDITEEPELVFVISKSEGFYEIKTILSYDDVVKDRLTAMSLYGRLW